MKRIEPVIVLDVIPKERNKLINLLERLSEEEWKAPTICTGWSVKDVAIHLLGNDIGILHIRDKLGREISAEYKWKWNDLVAFINEHNQSWVNAGRRISSKLLIDFLLLTGEQTSEYFKTVDLFSLGRPVSWAGSKPAPRWLDIAREYTERWVHQQQIRDATKKPGLTSKIFLSPVLRTFIRALPESFRDVKAADGTQLKVTITGDSGGDWLLIKEKNEWGIYSSFSVQPETTVELDEDTAWRLFTKGMTKDTALEKIRFTGNEAYYLKILDTIAIIA
jgi:uncharacterized protein (TIGR03083 family)